MSQQYLEQDAAPTRVFAAVDIFRPVIVEEGCTFYEEIAADIGRFQGMEPRLPGAAERPLGIKLLTDGEQMVRIPPSETIEEDLETMALNAAPSLSEGYEIRFGNADRQVTESGATFVIAKPHIEDQPFLEKEYMALRSAFRPINPNRYTQPKSANVNLTVAYAGELATPHSLERAVSSLRRRGEFRVLLGAASISVKQLTQYYPERSRSSA